jgi:hypothetical protein
VIEGEARRLDFAANLVEPLYERIGIRFRDDAGLGKHPAVGNAALDVVTIQALVNIDRGREALHDLRRALGESPLPEFFRHAEPFCFQRRASN